jgi:hypothetical protein
MEIPFDQLAKFVLVLNANPFGALMLAIILSLLFALALAAWFAKKKGERPRITTKRRTPRLRSKDEVNK